MGSKHMRILDLRLAERALQGEGRPKVAGRSCAISRQMKREDYRRDKLTRQIAKEQRQMRERLSLIERNFLSEQMFRKDLNPFQTVIKGKFHRNQAVVRDRRGEDHFVNDPHRDVIKERASMEDLGERWRSLDRDLLDRVLHQSKQQKPDALPRGKIDILQDSKESLNRNIFLRPMPTGKEENSNPPRKCVTYKDELVTFSSSLRNERSKTRLNYFANEKSGHGHFMDHQKLPNISDLRSKTIIGMTPEPKILRSALKKRSPQRLPLMSFSGSLLEPIPEMPSKKSKPKKKVTFWDCGDEWEASMKSYENILTEVCRALSPAEARRAEEKRIEAEDAGGITEKKQKMLSECRKTAEQDVFKDIRWTELIDTLGVEDNGSLWPEF